MHTVQRRQVFAGLNGVAGTQKDLLHRVIRQRFQPEFLDLAELRGIGESRVVLVVVVQPEQGEYLIDGLDARVAVLALPIIPPRRCL